MEPQIGSQQQVSPQSVAARGKQGRRCNCLRPVLCTSLYLLECISVAHSVAANVSNILYFASMSPERVVGRIPLELKPKLSEMGTSLLTRFRTRKQVQGAHKMLPGRHPPPRPSLRPSPTPPTCLGPARATSLIPQNLLPPWAVFLPPLASLITLPCLSSASRIETTRSHPHEIVAG